MDARVSCVAVPEICDMLIAVLFDVISFDVLRFPCFDLN